MMISWSVVLPEQFSSSTTDSKSVLKTTRKVSCDLKKISENHCWCPKTFPNVIFPRSDLRFLNVKSYPKLTLVEVVACLPARFGVVFSSKAGLSIQVQYTPISRSEVLCYDFVHRKETDRFWSHYCKRIVVNKNKLVCWPALKMIFSPFIAWITDSSLFKLNFKLSI